MCLDTYLRIPISKCCPSNFWNIQVPGHAILTSPWGGLIVSFNFSCQILLHHLNHQWFMHFFGNFLTVLQHIDWILTWRISFKSKSILHLTSMPQWLTQAVIHIPETRAWDRPQFSPLRIIKPLSSWILMENPLALGGEVAGDIGIDAFKAHFVQRGWDPPTFSPRMSWTLIINKI